MNELFNQIQKTLHQSFPHADISIINESHQHVGHANAGPGIYHIAVEISCPQLSALPRITAHRQIYQSLTHWMPRPLHAVRIVIKP